MSVLRSRLLAADEEKRRQELGDKRLSQIGSGDRSEKIRTYNYPQGPHHRPSNQLHTAQSAFIYGRRDR